MNLIDHRILIPTSPERVWHFVGDLKRNPEWQSNCRAIGVLTSTAKPQAGTRLRITPERGREYVIELSAWYDRFGYEYVVVEGSSFRDNKGTVRLQEVPEGTIVQWTFSYRPGLFGGGNARNQESLIIESLRGLYKLITKSKEVETFQAKSLMRDDPGVEARATYRPRHPFGDTAEGSAGRVKGTPRQPTKPLQPVVFSEPPIKPDDTKPRPVITDAPAFPPPAVVIPPVPYTASGPVVEPDFLIDEDDVPFVDVPSEKVSPLSGAAGTPIPPIPPVPYTPPPMTPVDIPIVKPITGAMQPVTPAAADSVSPPLVSEPPLRLLDTRELAPISTPPLADTASVVKQDTAPVATHYPTPAEAPFAKPEASPRRDKLTDTARISVFDVFGLPKPSETQEIKPLNLDAAGDPVPIALTEAGLAPMLSTETVVMPLARTSKVVSDTRRFGRRAVMRRKFARVRLVY
ncbi:MAG: SRPBCC family protein [Chloroflexi bacterium]|nr:SRPBCC family protein [Chloroflexota bacterium]